MEHPSGPTQQTSPRAIAISVLFWSYMALSLPVLWLTAVVVFAATALLDRERRLLHLYTCAWAYHYVKVMPLWAPHFQGVEQIEPGRAYVMVANHQSLGDILVLFGLFRHFKWVSKRSIFRVPFIGWNMRMNDYVGLLRGDAASIARMMEECRAHLSRGSSVMMFPEGTRSVDGEIKPFKHGAFTLAKELDLPVIPIVVEGTRDALPKRGLMFRQTGKLNVRVRVLSPVLPSDAPGVAELSQLVRARMQDELRSMRAERVPS